MTKYVSLFLRIGLAFSFIYAAFSSFINPTNWIGFIPIFIQSLIPATTLLLVFSVYEIALGIWLLTNKKIYSVSIISAVTLFVITIFNLGALDIVFRDVSLFFMALALVFLSKK